MRRLLSRLSAANADQIALWERYLSTQRPWQAQPPTLRWGWTPRGWRLRGSVLPEVRPQVGRRPVDHP
jgi:hypothetical protein